MIHLGAKDVLPKIQAHNASQSTATVHLLTCVVLGVFAITGSMEFFIYKFKYEELDFASGGFLAHIGGWMLLIAGSCGYCHGYDYEELDLYNNTIYPLQMDTDPLRFHSGMYISKKAEVQNTRAMPSTVSAGVIA